MDNKNQFKPYDRVLVRDHYDKRWKCDFYSHKSGETGIQTIRNVYSIENVIPYDGNEYLIGTMNEPEEETIELEDDEFLVCFDNIDYFDAKDFCLSPFYQLNCFSVRTKDGNNWNLFIRFKDFNPNDIEETRKHILCINEGKIVNYHDGK